MEALKLLKKILISARPKQWIKNLVVFAPAFLGGEILNLGALPKLIEAFMVFSLLSSCAYLINDVRDREKDRRHPVKKKRPIASGNLSPLSALVTTVLVGGATLFYTATNFNQYFFGGTVTFIILQLSYTFLIRDIIIMDALWVAAAFVVRVYSGAFVLPTPLSAWVVLSVIGLSLLLAFGKRRSERTLLYKLHKKLTTRSTLRQYPDALLDSMISLSASYSALAYSIFAFQTSPQGGLSFSFLPATLSSPKWIMLTIPVVFYGLARYLFVIYEKKEGESPEKVLLTDLPLLLTIFLWLAALFAIIYVL